MSRTRERVNVCPVTAPRSFTPTDDGQDDLTHWFCCEFDVALCGSANDPEADWEDDDVEDPDCVVCNELFDGPFCPKLGPTGCMHVE